MPIQQHFVFLRQRVGEIFIEVMLGEIRNDSGNAGDWRFESCQVLSPTCTDLFRVNRYNSVMACFRAVGFMAPPSYRLASLTPLGTGGIVCRTKENGEWDKLADSHWNFS